MTDEDIVARPHSASFASSSDSDVNALNTEEEVLSDAETNDADDYYLDVYKFVTVMKDEFQKRKEVMKIEIERRREAIQKHKVEVQEAVKSKRDQITNISKEKFKAGKKKLTKLQKKTIRRLKEYEPEENYRLKILFTKSVLTLVIKTFAVCAGQWLLPWYYSITCPGLIIWRLYTYWQNQWQYFLLDFCYFGNLVIFTIIWLYPSSPEYCSVIFSLANGMLYLGAFSFRNTLVFHSVDKMTSTYIHTVPVLLSFGIRWFPQKSALLWHDSFPTEPIPPSLYWNVLVPFCIVVLHTLLYTLLVNVILRPEEHIITSYRYLKSKSSVKKMFGQDPPYIVFVVMNWVMCLIFSLMTYFVYQYFYLHIVAMIAELVFIVWNGAGFYVDVFRMSIIRQASPILEGDKKEN